MSDSELPMTDLYPEIGFERRMDTVEFRVGERAHITVDGDTCRGCTTRACVVACPANLFVPTADGGILFNYEQCFECGTCYMVCNDEGAITWTYPDGGQGVVFRST
ncbi:MAG: 4Fe-4S dicluster domain-containing protein [Microthrixaceae bacterium]